MTKPLVVIFADTRWSIGSVHRDVAGMLACKYRFSFHFDANHDREALLQDLRRCDVLVATPNAQGCLVEYCWNERSLLRKCILLFHYTHGECQNIIQCMFFKEFHYATISRAVIPAQFGASVHWTPSGVRQDRFTHRDRQGQLKTLGWAGKLAWDTKRIDWSYKIASDVHLPLSLAIEIPYEQMNEWYGTIDVLLVTSGPGKHLETGPLPPFEAILCGVLAIGTAVGNFALVPGPKFETIAEAVAIIQDLRAHPERAVQLAQQQYDYVCEHFTLPKVTKKWVECFESVRQRQRSKADLQVLGVGHPRGGTAFASKYLQNKYDLAVGHERNWPNGNVSWLLAPMLNRETTRSVPFGHSYRDDVSYDIIVHIIRNPFTSIGSIMDENDRSDYHQNLSYCYRRDVINDLFGVDIDACDSEEEKAALSYLFWHKMIARRHVDAIWYVEREPKALMSLLSSHGCAITTGDVPRNVNSRKRINVDWNKLSAATMQQLETFCAEHGYESIQQRLLAEQQQPPSDFVV